MSPSLNFMCALLPTPRTIKSVIIVAWHAFAFSEQVHIENHKYRQLIYYIQNYTIPYDSRCALLSNGSSIIVIYKCSGLSVVVGVPWVQHIAHPPPCFYLCVCVWGGGGGSQFKKKKKKGGNKRCKCAAYCITYHSLRPLSFPRSWIPSLVL